MSFAVPDSPVAIKAYRAWSARETDGGLRLRSIWFPDDRVWPPFTRLEAECNACLLRRFRHRAPKVGHSCGIYAMKQPDDLFAWALDNTPPGGRPVVVGEVWCWGTVVEGTLGYRAQFAYPASFLGAWFAAPAVEARYLAVLSSAYGVPTTGGWAGLPWREAPPASATA
ncbi:MAG: hypothetical protein ACRDY7_15035 [Acidimicrobiia bacterium]